MVQMDTLPAGKQKETPKKWAASKTVSGQCVRIIKQIKMHYIIASALYSIVYFSVQVLTPRESSKKFVELSKKERKKMKQQQVDVCTHMPTMKTTAPGSVVYVQKKTGDFVFQAKS